jgi:AcrR family transcriptional regulator
MRALASELGVTTTTIYWHVGGRDELLTAIVERLAHKQAQQMIIGNSPGERIRSIAETIWANALAHRNVTALAHRTGTTNLLERPMKLAILRELEAAGVGGQEAISALQAVILCTAGFLVVAFRDGVEMEERGDLHATFTRTISAIVREFVPEPEAAGRDNHRPPETDTGDPDEPTQDMR